MYTSKYYKDLTIDEKINAKSHGFWRYPNDGGYILTMIDNANIDLRDDYADYMSHRLVPKYDYITPKH